MVLQYNAVFDRAGGLAQINNPNWPQWVSTKKPPEGDELAKGTYRPLLAPVNFAQSKKGTQYATVWFSGPLSIENIRGRFEFIPSNLQRFRRNPGGPGSDVEADPSLPDYKRDVQFTVNGLFQPVIKSKPGQTEIWVLANVSDIAYMSVQLTETATGKHPKIAIVGQDGNPSPAVHYPVFEDGTRLVIPPATRYAIAVTMPESGDLVLEMPPMGSGARTLSSPGILYENDGSENPPATLGTLSVPPSAISYFDGFFVFPTQVLARAVPSEGRGVSVAFEEGQKLGAYATFDELSKLTPDFKRQLTISGGFLNDLASKSDPKAFVYAFDGTAFPNVPLLQPRLNSVEEWTFINNNNDEHPIHVHVNDFQVTSYFDPTTGLKTGAEMWEVDNANVPAPTLGPAKLTIQSGSLSIRTKFEDYTGLFVMHCHRLNHEDNGLMTLVNVIPAVSTYAVAVHGSPGRAAEVKVYDGNGDRLIATVTPFPGFEGALSVAMGDVNDDNVLDLIVGAGENYAPMVVAYSGKATGGKAAFETQLARFAAFDLSARGGVSVTAAQIDGTTADNIIVGSGPGMPSEVRVFGTELPSSLGTAPALFSTFNPYANDQLRGERRLGLRRLRHRPLQHRHRARPRHPDAGEGLQLFADEAAQRAAGRRRGEEPMSGPQGGRGNRRVHAVRPRLQRRRLSGYRLADRAVGRRRGDRRRPAERSRHGESLLERLGAAGRPKSVFAERCGAHAHPHLHRHCAVQAVRPGLRGARRHDEHDGRRRPSRQRRVASGQNRKGSQIPARQANRRS